MKINLENLKMSRNMDLTSNLMGIEIMDYQEVRIAKISKELYSSIYKQIDLLSTNDSSFDLKSLLKDIHQFQPCPQLLDQHLKSYITKLQGIYIQGIANHVIAAEVFYTFGKIVGMKRMFNYMKPDIELIPRVLESFDRELHWFEEYLLLCWLIVLSFTPFQLSFFGKDTNEKVYSIAISQLSKSGPLQDLGSRLLSSFIMRFDAKVHLDRFLEDIPIEYFKSSETRKNGLLSALNLCLQKDTKLKLVDQIDNVYKFLKVVYSQESKIESIAKIYSKLAKYFDVTDKFDETEEIINVFTDNFSNKSTDARMIISRKYTKMITKVDQCLGIDLIIEIIHSTAEMIENEPMETLDANLLHTQLLVIAQLLYLDLVDAVSIKQIKEILKKTLFFQQAQITFISGSNIRDASNFIVWALARSSIKLEAELVLEIFTNLLFNCCFDKEIMIRRSSIAALQELIGRHGTRTWNELYPNDSSNPARSISIIEALDFIDSGSLDKSYLFIPTKILQFFPSLREKFIVFLSDNVYNLDHDLVKLSAKAHSILLKSESQSVIDQALSKFISRSKSKPFESFIGISNILPLSHNRVILKEILPIYLSIKLNHHKDQPFVLEAYLELFKSLVKAHTQPTELMFENLFNAIKINSPTIRTLLKEITPHIHLTSQYWTKWLYYIKNNNLNAASAISLLSNFKSNASDVLELFNNARVSAEIKAEILKSTSSYLQKESLDIGSMSTIIEQLDDYTISEQGDVGSKIRLATIQLIRDNMSIFQNEELKSFAEPKLLRLAAEPIDTIRLESIKLIATFRSESYTPFDTRDFEQYFNSLLKLYSINYMHDKVISLEFWKGYVFTAGALKATDKLIVSSLRSFVRFYESLDDIGRNEILLQLAANFKVETSLLQEKTSKANRLSKLILVGLQFCSRILQLNIQIPTIFNKKGLFIRIYNLHLNTNNITRLSNAIKIFGYLASVHNLSDPLERLCWLVINHSLPKVRTLASEELYIIYEEKYVSGNNKLYDVLAILKEVDWTQDIKSLKKYEKSIIEK